MLNERSGKTGYLLYSGDEIPIYAWILSASRSRNLYRTSISQSYPVRTPGLISETIIIRGVRSEPAQFWVTTGNLGFLTFEMGWNDLVAMNRKQVEVKALLTEMRVDFNYFSSPIPSFMWTATFAGCINDKEIATGIWDDQSNVWCANKLCDLPITTTDSTLNWDATLNTGLVKHVRRASLIESISRLNYATSNSVMHDVSTSGVRDRIVELDIQGDFDYWLHSVSFENDAHDYRFYTSDSLYWTANKMRVLDITNIVVNVQTGELISATVQLGASYSVPITPSMISSTSA